MGLRDRDITRRNKAAAKAVGATLVVVLWRPGEPSVNGLLLAAFIG